MASSRLSDLNEAFRDYFDPLERRFPDHPYKEEVEKFRIRHEALKNPTPGEAQHFYQLGQRLRQDGNDQAAHDVWSNLVIAFDGNDADRDWVQRAKKALAELEKAPVRGDRLKSIQPILDRAAALKADGKAEEAEKIWTALETLYSRDAGANDLLVEIRKQRQK